MALFVQACCLMADDTSSADAHVALALLSTLTLDEPVAKPSTSAALSSEPAPMLAEQPPEVIAMIGAALDADALEPKHLFALACTCWACKHALEPEVASIKPEWEALQALLLRCGMAIADVAAGSLPPDQLKSLSERGLDVRLDAADTRLLQRWIFDNPRMAQLVSMAALMQRRPAGVSDEDVRPFTTPCVRPRVACALLPSSHVTPSVPCVSAGRLPSVAAAARVPPRQ